MRWLASPMGMQVVGSILVVAGILFFGFLIIWKLRQDSVGAMSQKATSPSSENPAFAAAAFQGVIANLKERERSLQSQISEDARQTAQLQSLHRLVLENVGTGVLQIAPTLLVQQANPAARKILGYASPLNMHVRDVFRGLQNVDLPSDNGAVGGIGQAIREVFTSGSEYRNVAATYSSPSGEQRELRIAILPLNDPTQRVTSVLCLVEEA